MKTKIKHLCDQFETKYQPLEETHSILSKLLEESGELSQACRKYFGRKLHKENKGTIDSIREEIGDVLLIVERLAIIFDIDTKQALKDSVTKLEKRLTKYHANQRNSSNTQTNTSKTNARIIKKSRRNKSK